MHVPAVSITASTPHVSSPSYDHATIGNVPLAVRFAVAGAALPVQTSSIPPVPNVIFARPGRTQPCPTNEACWSPASAAIGGEPGSADAAPITPDESTSEGRIDMGMPSSSHTRSFQPDPSCWNKPVTAALEWSVTCSAPSESNHATQESTVPKHRSRSAAPGVLASSQAIFVADWFGASGSPCSILAMMHSPTVRRSCQPSAGPIGSPVVRSQMTVLARWFVIPTAVTGSDPASATAARAASSTSRPISVASNSTRPGDGVDGGKGR